MTDILTDDALTLAGGPDPLILDGVHTSSDPSTVDGEHDSLICSGGPGNQLHSPMLDGGLDPLTNYGEEDASTADPLTFDGESNSLTLDGGLRVAGVDWDKPQSCNISLPDGKMFTLPPDKFIEWYCAGAGGADVVCFERPHLRARGDFSRAQIWTAEDLERLVGGPPILMPNGKKLHKMAAHAGNLVEHKIAGKTEWKPDKNKDSESIRVYAEAHASIMRGWKRFVPPSADTTTQTHEHRDALRYEIGRTINEYRELWQDVKGKPAIRALSFMQPLAQMMDAIFDDLSDGTKKVFNLKSSGGSVNIAPGKTRLITVYVMAFDRNGALRTYNGRPLGRRYLMKDVVGLCDSYMPNMARANLTGYGKHGKAGADKRCQLNAAVKELLRAFQTYADPSTADGEHDSLTVDGGQ